MKRRNVLKAAGAIIGLGYVQNAAAQSKSETPKEAAMANPGVSTATITVEHVTIPSRKAFEAVKAESEALVPRLDQGILVLLSNGEIERARRALEEAPALSIFGFRDHGGLLKIYGLNRKAMQYDIGNPLTASKMTKHQLSAALYAPVRVLLRENAAGDVAFEYDRPKSVFGQFHDASVNAVAEKLDQDLQAVLQKAAV